ncbi:hypothetical protein V6N13_114714 [Hibiscus sabdariffa]
MGVSREDLRAPLVMRPLAQVPKDQEKRSTVLLLITITLIQQEIASMHATCKQHRARNVSLKRFKLDTKTWSSIVEEEEERTRCFCVSTSPFH